MRESFLGIIHSKGFEYDDEQLAAIGKMSGILLNIEHWYSSISKWYSRFSLFRQKLPKGLYLYGGVGRGKTYLMDCFFQSLSFSNKRRVHFHRFMNEIHDQLKLLPRSPDPLITVGKNIALNARVLCIDEFHVHDVADAMIMTRLLENLIANKVIIITTSNIVLEELYLDGLQRDQFVKTIQLLQDFTLKIDLGTGKDYRIGLLKNSPTYLVSQEKRDDEIKAIYIRFSRERFSAQQYIEINSRKIATVSADADIIWFEFDAICNTPRSTGDYMEIAITYHTVFISSIPVMTEQHDDAVKRFIHLIDALYDHRVKIVVSASVPPHDLYQGTRLSFAFERTASRLIEMQSDRYLQLAHRS